MTQRLFIRDKAAVENALYKSLAEFKHIYEEFDQTHDLDMIYDNIRKDAISKDKTLVGKLYKNDKQGAEPAKETDTTGVKKEEKVEKLKQTKSSNGDVTDDDIYNSILEFFEKDNALTPAKSFELIEEKYSAKFDKERVKKIHYKVYNKHYKNKK